MWVKFYCNLMIKALNIPSAILKKIIMYIKSNYSTIEKEGLALILAIHNFDIYICSSSKPTVVYSDHNPLFFLHKMNNKNRRLLNWSLMLQEHNMLSESLLPLYMYIFCKTL